MAKQQSMATLISIALIPLVMVLGNSMLVPVLPTMQSKLDLSQFQTSLIITVFSLAAGIVIPVVGYLSDRFGRKYIIVPALILYGIGGIISGLAAWFMDNSYMVILIGRVVSGIGAAGTSPIAMALIGDLYSGSQESKALGLIESTNGLGKIVSPIFGALIALIIWYAVFFVFPAICFLAALFVWFAVKEKKKKGFKPLPEYLGSLKNVFKQHGKWLVPAFLVGSVGLFILFGVLFYLSDILEKKMKIDGIIKGLVLAIPLLGMVTTAYITGTQIKHNNKLIRRLMIIGLIMLTGAMAVVSFFEQIFVMVSLLTVGSIGTGLLLPCLNTLITGAVDKSERGMITSLYSALRFFGVAFGPPIFGWLMGISHATLFLSMAGLSFVILILTLIFIRPGAKQKGGKNKEKHTDRTLFRRLEKQPT